MRAHSDGEAVRKAGIFMQFQWKSLAVNTVPMEGYLITAIKIKNSTLSPLIPLHKVSSQIYLHTLKMTHTQGYLLQHSYNGK